jgi:tRNA nucleotidyltransferase (CCA-adding enzyme)
MSLKGISTERIELEFDKLFLKSKRPSLGIRWLAKIGRLSEILPELADTMNIAQDPDWHPEGNVFEHTMQALDAAAVMPCEGDQEKLTLLYGALCHDLGKALTTEKVNGRWVSYEHEIKGIPLAKQMLHRLTRRVELIDAVGKLVHYHMAPGTFVDQGAKPPAYKRLANKLAPEVTISLLAKLALADKRGRNPQGHEPLKTDFPELDEFLEKAAAAQVTIKPEEPVLQGRDLFGKVEPGPEMGKLLKKAYEIQIDEGIKDKDELLKRILP